MSAGDDAARHIAEHSLARTNSRMRESRPIRAASLGVVTGIVAANPARSLIIVAGLAEAVAGAISMGWWRLQRCRVGKHWPLITGSCLRPHAHRAKVRIRASRLPHPIVGTHTVVAGALKLCTEHGAFMGPSR